MLTLLASLLLLATRDRLAVLALQVLLNLIPLLALPILSTEQALLAPLAILARLPRLALLAPLTIVALLIWLTPPLVLASQALLAFLAPLPLPILLSQHVCKSSLRV